MTIQLVWASVYPFLSSFYAFSYSKKSTPIKKFNKKKLPTKMKMI